MNQLELRWTKIPGFKNYIISNKGDVMRVARDKGATVGKILKKSLRGLVIYNIDSTGQLNIYRDYRYPIVMLRENGKKYIRSVSRLLAISFGKNKPFVQENKISNKLTIKKELTKMIVEKIDPTLPCTTDNLRWNFIPRGERHWNHKLDNNLVLLIRQNLHMNVKDFINLYKDLYKHVSLSTVRRVFRGETWRVRTKPLKEMTYLQENFPNGEFVNWLG